MSHRTNEQGLLSWLPSAGWCHSSVAEKHHTGFAALPCAHVCAPINDVFPYFASKKYQS